jgi:hypothetical protein
MADEMGMVMTDEPRHPLTGEPTNAARAARVERAIRQYAEDVYHVPGDRNDHDTVLQDFLTDVFHCAASAGLNVEDVMSRAFRMFDEELEQENPNAERCARCGWVMLHDACVYCGGTETIPNSAEDEAQP